jgi:hypothetical protein
VNLARHGSSLFGGRLVVAGRFSALTCFSPFLREIRFQCFVVKKKGVLVENLDTVT